MRANWFTLFSTMTGLSLALAGCGSDNLTLPSEGEATRIVVAEGNGQQGRVGDTLSLPVAVVVTDSKDRPVVGVAVNFAVQDGSDGSAAPAQVLTSDSGIARTTVTLGHRVGPVTGRAWIAVEDDQPAVETEFTAEALPADAYGLTLKFGDMQSAPVGTVLSDSLVVLVTDAFGNPIANQPVNWAAEGGGTVSATSTQTDASGETWVERTLGPTAGPQTTTASAAGLAGSPVVFSHTAIPGNAARVIIVDGNGQQAAPSATLPEPLVVQVLDAENNPIVGRPVTWVIGTGEGRVNPGTSNTDAQGHATTQWTLGSEPGQNTVSAVVSGVGVAAFTATAVAPKTSSSTSIISHQPEPSAPGQAVQVQVQVTGSGGTPSGIVTVTGENAAAPCTITLSNGAGACSLTFNAEGQQRITATYGGDTRFNGSDDNENHRVQALPQNSAPSAAFTPPTNCVVGQPCQFTDQSTDSDGSVAGWTWDFGGEATSDQQHPAYAFNEARSYNVTLTVRDDDGANASVTHAVTVNPPPNGAPNAVADVYSTPIGQPLFVDASNGVLANDSDPENNSLTVESYTQPTQGGIVTVDPDGSFEYFPGVGSGTQDSFTYTVTDGTSDATTTVTINFQ